MELGDWMRGVVEGVMGGMSFGASEQWNRMTGFNNGRR